MATEKTRKQVQLTLIVFAVFAAVAIILAALLANP